MLLCLFRSLTLFPNSRCFLLARGRYHQLLGAMVHAESTAALLQVLDSLLRLAKSQPRR